jgi:paired small multidrug resistance pump
MAIAKKQKAAKIHEFSGWAGVVLILLAYSLITLGILQPTTPIYGVMNLFGALGIIVSSYSKRDLQPVFLNLVWLFIAAIGIFKSIA